MDDGLRPVIPGSSLGTEDERRGRKVLQRAILQLIVDRQNGQGVHQLPLVFVQPLYLHVKDHAGIQGHAFLPLNFLRQLTLLFLLHLHKSPAQIVVNHGLQLGQLIQIRQEILTAKLVFQQCRQFRVAQSQPAALGNAVGLVLEAFRIQGIPVRKHVLFQNFGVDGRHAVGGMGGIHSQLRHMHLGHFGIPRVGPQNAASGLHLMTACLHFLTETGINLPNHLHQFRAYGSQQRQIPLFQCFLHHRVIGVGKGFPGNGERRFEVHAILSQQANQFRNGHHGMGIIQLRPMLPGKEGVITAVTGFVAAQQVLQGSRHQHILLLHPQLLAFLLGIVGVQEFGNVLCLVLVAGCPGILLLIEQGEINFMQALALPQAQGADVLCPIANDGHIIGHSQHIARFHFHCYSQIVPANAPRIAPLCPVVRLFMLPAIHKALLKQAVAIPEAIAGQRHLMGHCTVQEAGCQPSQAAVAKGVILNILQAGKIHIPLRQQLFRVLQQSQAEQIVVHHAAYQIFRRQVIGLPLALTLLFALHPGRRQCLHGGGSQSVMQLHGCCFLQRHMVTGHQQRFAPADQFLGIHHQLASLFVS